MGPQFPFHATQVLTLVTTIFCPAQFLCGVYGMNFVDDTGRPGIPELLWKNGYLYFWLLILGYLSLGGEGEPSSPRAMPFGKPSLERPVPARIVAFVSAAHLYRRSKGLTDGLCIPPSGSRGQGSIRVASL